MNRFKVHDDFCSLFDGRVAAAVELAELAGRKTLEFFRNPELEWERKSDDSPVTVADKAAESAVRQQIAIQYPGDAIEGEEFGKDSSNIESEYQWIIDPIDGTKSFLCGVPLYSTLIGLTRNGEPVAGVIYIPALGEMIFGIVGHGSWYGRDLGLAERCQFARASVSKTTSMSDSIFVVSQIDNFAKFATDMAYKRIEQLAYISRTWGDGYGYLMVATGRAEIMVDPIVNAWDVAAVWPVITEAGGKCTSWQGVDDIRAGNMVATNGALHAEALKLLT